MKKKIKRWLRQKFCKHNFVVLWDPALTDFIRECENNRKQGSSYSYTVETQCTKCGKFEYVGSGTIY